MAEEIITSTNAETATDHEYPGLGGAMLAAVACGEYTSVEDAASHIVKIVDTVEPDPDLVKKYDEKYQKFAKIYPALKDIYSEIV